MQTNKLPSALAMDLLERSSCNVQVAAILSDKRGIFAWGWNHCVINGGKHAEFSAIEGANKKRLKGATLTVIAKRKKNKSIICAKPCTHIKEGSANSCKVTCMSLAIKHKIKKIVHSTIGGNLETILLNN
jgi:pyrimidine deaminase RibD-like protein